MKTTLTIVLLMFVAASVVFLMVGGSTSKPEASAALSQGGKVATAGNLSAPQEANPANAPARAPLVIAYYFHGTARCPTCLRMEKWAREAVEEMFEAEIEAGSVRWLAVNYDEPANEHFVKEYELIGSAVVLAPQGEESRAGWRNLTRIWELSRDEVSFKSYVADELTDLLKGDS